MPQEVTLEAMFMSGMYLGHFTREWNPRMRPYIYGERNGRHILDLVQSYFLLKKVLNFLQESAAKGKTFLFVGTKKQAAPLIARTALACNSYYVNQRWLGGMLTNWRTIKKSLRKLQEYRQAEENGDWNLLKKQEVARKRREKDRLEKYLAGLQNMSQLPGVVILVGQMEEIHAVKECRQLGIPTVTLLDSNCDPRLADWFIPANDDSFSTLCLLLGSFRDAIKKGQALHNQRMKKATLKKYSPSGISSVAKSKKPGELKRPSRRPTSSVAKSMKPEELKRPSRPFK